MAKHILVVDDDGDVRNVLVAMLEESGFLASPADCGAAMRDILARPGTVIDAVVLDSMMPGESGAELALYAKNYRISKIQRTNHSAVPPYSARPEPLALADLLVQGVWYCGSCKARVKCVRTGNEKGNPARNGSSGVHHVFARPRKDIRRNC